MNEYKKPLALQLNCLACDVIYLAQLPPTLAARWLAMAAINLSCRDFVLPLSVDLSVTYCDAELALPIDDPVPSPTYWYLSFSTNALQSPA